MSTLNRFALFFCCLLPAVGGLWAGTQKFAQLIQYDTQFLGPPLLQFGTTTLYAPWKLLVWYGMYRVYVPGLFKDVMMYPIGGLILFFILLVIFRPQKQLTSHGSAHWGAYKDLVRMGLISGSGVVVGLYDNTLTKQATALLRYLENKKNESESYGEMSFDKHLEKERARHAQVLAKLTFQRDMATPGSKPSMALDKEIAKHRSWLENPPAYKPKKGSSAYLWKRLYDTAFGIYTKLPHFYLRDNQSRHVVLVAPTRSGKGVGVIVPTLLGGWKESVIVNDIKSENWGITAGYRKKMGQRVIKFEPTCADGSSARWNPLDEIRIGTPEEVSTAQNIANVIANYEGKENADHWIANAANVITMVILHLKYAHCTDKLHYPNPPNLYTVASFLKAAAAPTVLEDGTIDDAEYSVQDFVTAIQGLQNYEHVPKNGIDIEEWDMKQQAYVTRHFTPDDLHALYPDDFIGPSEAPYTHPIINRGFIEIAKKPDNELGSIISTANTALKEYLDPVLTMNTRCSDFCIDDLMKHPRPVSLYLITPPSDLLRMSPIFRLFFELMVGRHTKEIAEYKNGRAAKPAYLHKCLLLMDEFNSLGNLKRFVSAFAFTAGFGMKGFLVMQGLDQLFKTYGKDNEIPMNTSLQIFFSPNEDKTAAYLEKNLGNQTIIAESISDTGQWFRKNISRSEISRPLMTAEETRRLGDNEIIFAQNNPPILTQKIRYYEQDFFTRKLADAPYVSDVLRTGGRAETINANPRREERLAQRRQKLKETYGLIQEKEGETYGLSCQTPTAHEETGTAERTAAETGSKTPGIHQSDQQRAEGHQ